MRTAIVISLFILLIPPLVYSTEARDSDLHGLTPLQHFAVDGLSSGSVLMGQSLDTILKDFELPDRIEIRKESSYWDIDLEQTPADWIYSGFVITTLYYRDGLHKKGDKHLVPGPYYKSDIVDGIRVISAERQVLFGLGVGATTEDILKKLGIPGNSSTADYRNKKRIVYRDVEVSDLVGRDVDIMFLFDESGSVKEVLWSRASWH